MVKQEFRTWEISGNLCKYDNYNQFSATLNKVHGYFVQLFGRELMSKIDLYVDNVSTENDSAKTGYTPITTPILKKYIIIKLNIHDFSDETKIVFQFSHELCHYIFYALMGLDKLRAGKTEESICTAMSLFAIQKFYPALLNVYERYVRNLTDEGYKNGYDIAHQLKYDGTKMVYLISSLGKSKEFLDAATLLASIP